ncbi:unnamed protein product [Cochlearia groenlandica]
MVEPHDIGLNSLIVEAPGNLGTKDRMVAFAADGRKAVMKKCLIEAMTSGPIIVQAPLKKPDVRPFGPRALFGFNFKMTDAISSA